jgi:hypothetical protein
MVRARRLLFSAPFVPWKVERKEWQPMTPLMPVLALWRSQVYRREAVLAEA